MAKTDLIDFVGCSNGWQTSWDVPYDQLRKDLGDQVAIYGVIEDAPNWMDAHNPKTNKSGYRLLSASVPLLYGNAAGKPAMGADGLEQFNFFCTDEVHHNPAAGKTARTQYAALRGLEKLENLRGKPKHYALATMYGHWIFDEWEYAEQIPVILEPEWRRVFRLSMSAEPPGSKLDLILQLVVKKREGLPDLGVSFNGSWPNFDDKPTDELLFPCAPYTHHISKHQAFNYRLMPSMIKEGWNEIVVYNGSHQRATPKERVDHSVCRAAFRLRQRGHAVKSRGKVAPAEKRVPELAALETLLHETRESFIDLTLFPGTFDPAKTGEKFTYEILDRTIPEGTDKGGGGVAGGGNRVMD